MYISLARYTQLLVANYRRDGISLPPNEKLGPAGRTRCMSTHSTHSPYTLLEHVCLRTQRCIVGVAHTI